MAALSVGAVEVLPENRTRTYELPSRQINFRNATREFAGVCSKVIPANATHGAWSCFSYEICLGGGDEGIRTLETVSRLLP